MIRTKIIATMGPATRSTETLYKLFEAGVDICRLNFSHGTLDEHLLMLRMIREAAARFDRPIAVLGDLCGPKIRLSKIADVDGTGGLPLEVGDTLVIQREPIVGNLIDGEKRVSSIYDRFVDDVQVGDRILIEDGLIRFVCVEKDRNEVRANCTVAGVLKNNKGINLPNTHVNAPSITERDWECADWAIENDIDYVALSFVRSAEDLNTLRQHLRKRNSTAHLIAKIEKSEAIKQIDEIIDASDGLMVARGDLGVEMDVAEVPILQKDLIRRCQNAGKPVIVATQMLQSMVDAASPTRAEVSDVANAIYDGTDAVMLSGETSVGKFAIVTVHTMAHIADVTERYLTKNRTHEPAMRLKTLQMSAAVAKGVYQMVQELGIKLVIIWSQSGETARIFSKTRFPVPIIAMSSDHGVLRRMALHYGVVPQEMVPPDDITHLAADTDQVILARKFAEAGDRIIIVAGASMGTPGTLNGVFIHTVGEQFSTNPLDRPSGNSVAIDSGV
ncbi:MAG TPA: pyruvate kinase [Tepidisphaeraceae bacterium]|jgi:pyruvate kinase|nr:pyruvate kinase [Tepidisphaeraceae bacterium]